MYNTLWSNMTWSHMTWSHKRGEEEEKEGAREGDEEKRGERRGRGEVTRCGTYGLCLRFSP